MSTGKPLPLKALIDGPDSPLGSLIRRSADVEALTREVRCLVPESLRPHILAACSREAVLHVVADTSGWAAKLRYLADDILISLNARQGRSLQKLHVSVSAGA